jgi:serine/threonine protein kinase
MPLAQPVLQSDDIAEPEFVVSGIAEVAETMARLHHRGVFHRDLKPSNLLILDHEWAVGDFGIASFPEKAALTTGRTKLGPIYFLAPEMLHGPEKAAGGPADVYSLAKTLWVLVAGQNYPPPGEQRQDIVQVRLEKWSDHPRIALLNPLLEACTKYSPSERPEMAALREALVGWSAE